MIAPLGEDDVVTEVKRPNAREINDTIRYTMWAVYSRASSPAGSLDDAAAELDTWANSPGEDVVVRGIYDVSGMRANADLMIWLHGPTAEGIQAAMRDLRRTAVGEATTLVWSAMGIHRPAEFNRGHVPAFMEDKPALDWLCMYPFVRSYEWYLLPEEERRALLVEHGMRGRHFPMIQSNTVAAFALQDYEWVLALESPQLHDLVDMMRDLRTTGARRHVREEIPFYTGRRVSAVEAIDVLR